MQPQALLLYCVACLLAGVYGQTIDGVRLVGGNYNYGTLEVRVNGVWGRVCNARSGTDPGFDNNAASAACAMLGFRPVFGTAASFPALLTGSPNTVLAVQSCTGFREASQSTWNLRTCALLSGSSIPAACSGRANDAGVTCTGQTTTSTTTPGPTTTPNLATVAPVNCANVTDLSLSPGPNEGLVLIRNPSTNAFGTICAEAFGISEATTICRMLCRGTVNAIGYSGKYVTEAARYPVQLSGLRCPANANSTNFCSHNGWGTASGVCSGSSTAVSVRCNELPLVPPPIPTASVVCYDYAAHVYFNRTEVSTSALLTLQGGFNASVCNFTVGENATHVWATIPYLGCRSVESSNDTHIIYTSRLFKNVTAVGIVFIDSSYVYTVACAVAKPNEVTARLQPDVRTVPPIAGGDTYTSEVRLYEAYSASVFSSEILPTKKLTVGQKVYAKVSVLSPLSVRLIVRSCWATATPGGTERYFIILNKCPAASSTLFRVDDKSVGLNFIVMSFSSSNLTQVYIYCDVAICRTTETTSKCSQVCGTTVRRRRAAEDGEDDVPTRRPYDGPFELVMAGIASGAGRLAPATAAVALIAIANLLRQFGC